MSATVSATVSAPPRAVATPSSRRAGRVPAAGPGALVIGGDYQGLGIARSLGRHGIPVCVLDDERSPASVSRHVRHTTRVADLRSDDAALAAIERAARDVPMDGWLLYPTRDETVALLARHRGELEPRFRVTSPSWDAVRVCWDKRETYRVAADLGIAHPRTWVPDGPDDLDDVDAEGPFVVKPAIKEHFFYRTGVKAWRVDAREELAAVVARATAVAGPGEVLVQELVPGGGREQYSYCALVRAGSPVAVMTVVRRRQHPSDFGRASTYVETVDLPELDAPSERFLASTGYDGLVEIEYKRDPRDGRAKLLDVNARTWGYHSLGPASGVDFPYLLYRDRVAATPAAPPATPVRTRSGVRWVRLATDLPNAVRDIASGSQRLGAYLRTLPGADTEAVFSLRDPLPWFYECALLPYLAVRRGL